METEKRRHAEGQSFSCSCCSETFLQVTKLLKHVDSSGHLGLTCGVCRLQVKTEAAMSVHLDKHRTPKRPFSCQFCNSKFRSNRELGLHMPKHTDTLAFVCSICQKGFKWKQVLKMHMMTHSKEANHLCPTCGFSSKHKSTLITHMNRHVGRSFSCPEPGCKFSTAREQNLREHIKHHKKETMFHCSSCPMTFSQKKNLTRHLAKHNPSLPTLTCPFHIELGCTFHTLRKDKLATHVKTKHESLTGPGKTDERGKQTRKQNKTEQSTSNSREFSSTPASSTSISNEFSTTPTLTSNSNNFSSTQTFSSNEFISTQSFSSNELISTPSSSSNEFSSTPSLSSKELSSTSTLSSNEFSSTSTLCSKEFSSTSTLCNNEFSSTPTFSSNEFSSTPTFSSNEFSTKQTSLSNSKNFSNELTPTSSRRDFSTAPTTPFPMPTLPADPMQVEACPSTTDPELVCVTTDQDCPLGIDQLYSWQHTKTDGSTLAFGTDDEPYKDTTTKQAAMKNNDFCMDTFKYVSPPNVTVNALKSNFATFAAETSDAFVSNLLEGPLVDLNPIDLALVLDEAFCPASPGTTDPQ